MRKGQTMTATNEGIDFRDDGTITVRFDGQTWTVGRPKFSHWRKYSRAFTESAERAIAPLRVALDVMNRADTAVKAARENGDKEAEAAAEAALAEAVEAFNEINREDLMIEENARLLRDIFNELADRPLPDDLDDWAPWLILPPARDSDGTPGPAVPARIVGHWRNVPKASSPAPDG